jgi:hypothetical protein
MGIKYKNIFIINKSFEKAEKKATRRENLKIKFVA